jgi:hypothetical protein
MKIENKDEYIKYRFQRAEESLDDALIVGDYGDLFDFDDKIVLPLVDQVKDFVTEIKKLIDQ